MKNRYQFSVRFQALPLALVSLLAASALLPGCGEPKCLNGAKTCTGSNEIATTKEALGESVSPSFTFNYNEVDQLSPNRNERAIMALVNRALISPTKYGFEVSQGKGKPAISAAPSKPKVYVPEYKNEMIWWVKHQLEYNCRCSEENSADASLLTRACSKLAVVNGLLTTEGEREYCIGPKDDDDVRLASFRAAYFGRGPATGNGGFGGRPSLPSIGRGHGLQESHIKAGVEFSGFAITYLTGMIKQVLEEYTSVNGYGFIYTGFPSYKLSEEGDNKQNTDDKSYNQLSCQWPRTECEYYGGVCKSARGKKTCKSKTSLTYCEGVCDGGSLDGSPCVVPNKERKLCEKQDGLLPVFGFESSTDALTLPLLQDGIAMRIGPFPAGVPDDPFKTKKFDVTPDGQVEFSVIYNEPSADAKHVYAVIDGQKFELSKMSDQDPQPSYSDPSKYYGVIYKANKSGLMDGCHKYYFVAETASGMTYTFPKYGSLGVATAGGNINFDNMTDLINPPQDKCNSYYPGVRAGVDFGATVKQCAAGDTRPCYSGSPADLAGEKTICKRGTETCTNDGYWSGVCTDEVLPKGFEICKDEVDNNCDGHVDEGCPTKEEKTTQGGTSSSTTTPAATTTTQKKGGCSTTQEPGSLLAFLLAAFGLLGISRRRRS